MRGLALVLGLLWVACDPYGDWPDPQQVFPYVYTAETGLEPYELVRWETESWDPYTDGEKTGLYLKKAVSHKLGAPKEVLEHFRLMRDELPPLGAGARLSFVGDVMWAGGNWDKFATPAAPLLDGQLRLGNLETPVSPDHPTEQAALGLYAFNAPTEMLEGLPLDLLQLNNNHSLDADDQGLENTLREVKAHGYRQVGVDSQTSLEVGGRKLAVLAYTWGINDGRRSERGHELHIVPFGHIGTDVDLSLLEQQAARARSEGAEIVVVLVHWGFEYELYPEPHFMVIARRIVKAGADLVVGHGPHVVQPAEICHVNRPEVVPGVGRCSVRTDDDRPRTAAVLYSLGNFSSRMYTIHERVGLVATASVEDGVTGLGWAGVASQELAEGLDVLPLAVLAGEAAYAAEASWLDKHLGTSWRR
jgi:hypothetical protein